MRKVTHAVLGQSEESATVHASLFKALSIRAQIRLSDLAPTEKVLKEPRQ
jgi:hypothetical protein